MVPFFIPVGIQAISQGQGWRAFSESAVAPGTVPPLVPPQLHDLAALPPNREAGVSLSRPSPGVAFALLAYLWLIA